MALVASREIKTNEEITIDYHWTFSEQDEVVPPCFCRSIHCRKVLMELPEGTIDLKNKYDEAIAKVA